ncbi:nucleotidyltransferase domain-containing protein [Mariniphaga sp.]|uniref:nucleotidyltransferase domain-containing protein n=1 Tax=Mariniphaga sp. TaxID=1954475 RepID=UPI003565C8FF
MINKTTISNIVAKIASKIHPDRIYLVGSYATGHANEDSDIDLLIIKNTTEPKYKRSIEIQRILKGSKLPVDIVVYTNDEFENEKLKKYSFVNSAIQDAQLMYENRN